MTKHSSSDNAIERVDVPPGETLLPDRDPDDIKIEARLATRFPRVAHEPVERRTKVTWCVGGKDVLTDLGDGTYEVTRWPHASIEDLERLYYVIAELLSITQPNPSK